MTLVAKRVWLLLPSAPYRYLFFCQRPLSINDATETVLNLTIVVNVTAVTTKLFVSLIWTLQFLLWHRQIIPCHSFCWFVGIGTTRKRLLNYLAFSAIWDWHWRTRWFCSQQRCCNTGTGVHVDVFTGLFEKMLALLLAPSKLPAPLFWHRRISDRCSRCQCCG